MDWKEQREKEVWLKIKQKLFNLQDVCYMDGQASRNNPKDALDIMNDIRVLIYENFDVKPKAEIIL